MDCFLLHRGKIYKPIIEYLFKLFVKVCRQRKLRFARLLVGKHWFAGSVNFALLVYWSANVGLPAA